MICNACCDPKTQAIDLQYYVISTKPKKFAIMQTKRADAKTRPTMPEEWKDGGMEGWRDGG
ncbi:MAG: hypothetical protein NTV22_11150, partial [bacterium]|nr:hypothetical protein [bacterium]